MNLWKFTVVKQFFGEKDEWHETKTDAGLTAIVIESEELDTSSLMPL